MFIEYLLHQLS